MVIQCSLRRCRLKCLHGADYVPVAWSGYTVLITSLQSEVVIQCGLRPCGRKWLHSADYVPVAWSGYTVLITSLQTAVLIQCWLRPYRLKWLHSGMFLQAAVHHTTPRKAAFRSTKPTQPLETFHCLHLPHKIRHHTTPQQQIKTNRRSRIAKYGKNQLVLNLQTPSRAPLLSLLWPIFFFLFHKNWVTLLFCVCRVRVFINTHHILRILRQTKQPSACAVRNIDIDIFNCSWVDTRWQ